MRRWIVLFALCFAACSEGTTSDAGAPSPDAASAEDAGFACACDPEERCAACFENLDRCCYGGGLAREQRHLLTVACEDQPACRACCRECAEASCETLRATGSCPATVD